MKLNSQIYREAAEVAWKNGHSRDSYDRYYGYCCCAIRSAASRIAEELDESNDSIKHVAALERLFYPKRKEVTEKAWEDMDTSGYWGKCSKETVEYRVFALLLLAEMAEAEEQF